MSRTEQSTNLTEESIFETTSDTELSTADRYRRAIDSSVLAPLRVLWSDWRGKAGILIVLFYVFLATVGVWVLPRPSSRPSETLEPPFQSWEYILGTDGSGQGLLASTVYATPQVLKMILAGAVFAILVGAMVGMVAGYKGGLIDQVLMAFTDSLMTIPGLPLVIVLAFIFEPRSPYLIGILLAINNWTGLARSIRSQMLPLREAEYVEASRLMGMPTTQIIRRDVVPNLMPYISINFVNASRRIIFESVALYFLGILPTSKPNWGVMIQVAYSSGGALYSLEAAHWLIVPMLAIVFLSFGLILLAQAGDRVFNPRIRARHETTSSDETAP